MHIPATVVGPENSRPETRRHFLRKSIVAGSVLSVALHDDAAVRMAAAVNAADDRAPDDIAADEDFWREIQQAFTIDRSMINFNNGGVSPSPRIAQDAMRRHLEFANNAPARNLWQYQDPQVETVRARLARAFGCETDEMAITRNASESLEICIYGIDLKAGDEVLTTDQDYPRMLTTYRQREMRDGIVLKTVPIPAPVDDPLEIVEVFAKNITPKTRVILCCHVVNITGQIFPVREIVDLGRRHNIPVIVDGAHAFAHIAFSRDQLDCDYYGTSLHKWLTAPHGTGFLYVRKSRIADLWPLMAAVKPRSDDIRKFEEIGTHPAANRLAIAEALTLHELIGPKRKEARLRYLRDRWARRLTQDRRVKLYTSLEPRHSCGVATMAVEGVSAFKLQEFLWAKHRIFTVAIDHEQIKGIRVTPNIYSTMEEVDMFCEAVEHVLVHGLPTS